MALVVRWAAVALPAAAMLASGGPAAVAGTRTAAGGQDLLPPRLESVRVSPAAVDAGAGGRVKVSAVATDDLSGVTAVTVYLDRDGGGQLAAAVLHRTGGTARHGTWSGSIVLQPHGTAPGTYRVGDVIMRDRVGNHGALTVFHGRHLTVQVSNRKRLDTEPPAAVSGRITPGIVDVTENAQLVTYRLRVRDDFTGVAQVSVLVKVSGPAPAEGRSVKLVRVAGTARNGLWKGTLRVPRYSQPGTWIVYDTELVDAVGNHADLSDDPFTNQLQVLDSTPDTTGPELVSESRTPDTIDTRTAAQQVHVTVQGHDAAAGVRTVTVYAGGRLDELGDPGYLLRAPLHLTADGSWTGDLTFPRYSWQGTWSLGVELTDQTGNVSFLDPAALSAAGFPSTVINVTPSSY